jgi:vacuolar iron transporter family protein
MPPSEHHFVHRTNWLRAAVLGANDGIVSTTSLLAGVAAAGANGSALLITGIAATVAGALSMAAGEYVSVSSQSDTEKADLARERKALTEHRESELDELADIYRERGIQADLAKIVAEQLMAHNALEAHARDELGISHVTATNPLQAAWSSALAFSAGSALPLTTVLLFNRMGTSYLLSWLCLASLGALALLGWWSAKNGGVNPARAVLRILFWGSTAMIVTMAIGKLFHLTL